MAETRKIAAIPAADFVDFNRMASAQKTARSRGCGYCG